MLSLVVGEATCEGADSSKVTKVKVDEGVSGGTLSRVIVFGRNQASIIPNSVRGGEIPEDINSINISRCLFELSDIPCARSPQDPSNEGLGTRRQRILWLRARGYRPV